MQDLSSFLTLLFTIFVLLFIAGPIAIFSMFPSMSPLVLGSGYTVVALAAIAWLTGDQLPHALVQFVLRTVAFTIVGPTILLTAFPSRNRFVLIVSYLIVLGFALAWYIRRLNRKRKEQYAAEEALAEGDLIRIREIDLPTLKTRGNAL